MALWIPMWLVDALMLIAAFMLFTPQANPDDDNEAEGDGDEGAKKKNEDEVPLPLKLLNLLQTSAFILIQVFVLLRLDRDIRWDWFAVFAPWFTRRTTCGPGDAFSPTVSRYRAR
jgi:hypothetical protein